MKPRSTPGTRFPQCGSLLVCPIEGLSGFDPIAETGGRPLGVVRHGMAVLSGLGDGERDRDRFPGLHLKPVEALMPHAPGHIRDTFLAAVDAFVAWKPGQPEPTVEHKINYNPRQIRSREPADCLREPCSIQSMKVSH